MPIQPVANVDMSPKVCPCCGSILSERPAPQAAMDMIRLGPTSRAIVNVLVRSFGLWVPSARLVTLVYADDVDGGPLCAQNVMSVTIIKLRPRVARAGFVIDGKQWHGYRLRWADKVASYDAN